jgi:hypothetical protein
MDNGWESGCVSSGRVGLSSFCQFSDRDIGVTLFRVSGAAISESLAERFIVFLLCIYYLV